MNSAKILIVPVLETVIQPLRFQLLGSAVIPTVAAVCFFFVEDNVKKTP